MLWPQVRLRTSVGAFRVDALVLVKIETKVAWFILEVDGPHHQPERDRLRNEAIALPEVRFSQAEIESGRVVAKFLSESHRLLNEVGTAA
ncbi:MAG: hypothetical protein KIS61_12890 [Candidatus Eremiobacteraeota bacterium]|nr:hypothetical protein [Candidatus Eremiobacteraeota bacterium]